MKVVFLKKFSKDLDKITDQKMRNRIHQTILDIENANSSKNIKSLKKLKGEKDAYRIRIGSYRLGVYIENNIVEVARIAHRKDIYDIFP